MRAVFRWPALLVCALIVSACGGRTGLSTGSRREPSMDASSSDAGVLDAGFDASARDAGSFDGGVEEDAGPPDGGPLDGGARDAAPGDAGQGDAGPRDAGPRDGAGAPDRTSGSAIRWRVPGCRFGSRRSIASSRSSATWPRCARCATTAARGAGPDRRDGSARSGRASPHDRAVTHAWTLPHARGPCAPVVVGLPDSAVPATWGPRP